MTEETPERDSAPGSGAGDSAPTQSIPHMAKPAKKASGSSTGSKTPPPSGGASAAAKPSSGRPTGQKSSQSKSSSSSPVPPSPAPVTAAETDKGRTRETSSSKPPDRQRLINPIGGPTGPPLTASDYARTTKPSAATTSVIPAVKDEPRSTATAPPRVTLEPVDSANPGRQASLRLVRIDPWSVTRLAFAISVAMMIVGVFAVGIFWIVLSVTGVWGQINDSVTSVLSDNSSSFNITDYLGFGRLVGLTLVLSGINVILTTALAAIAARLYNLAAQLLGGIEVTFAEEK